MKTPKKPPRPEIEWRLASAFEASWRQLGKGNTAIKAAMTEFNRCKRSDPPEQLPGRMKEHKLDGPLKGFYDCHLADDVILIYKPLANGVYKLFTLCTHADLMGPKAKILKVKLK
jgi:mRNA-degrading endonuclease YafQ of YafQ-DinJ toxin-antitoxin module